MSLIILGTACTKTLVITKPVPCVVLDAPKYPEVRWLECTTGMLCLESADAREFALWVIAVLNYHKHIEEMCGGLENGLDESN